MSIELTADGRPVHPEAKAGEVFIGNVYAVDFAAIGWTSKRLGKQAWDIDGTPQRGGRMKPVFVQRKEVVEAGVAIPVTGTIDHRW